MKTRYSISEARANLPGIIDRVEVGQAVELTRRGKPVAVVVSVQELARLKAGRQDFRTAYRGFLDGFNLEEDGLEVDFFEKTRDAGQGREVDV